MPQQNNSFEARFLAFCQQYQLLETDSILVAFSGGSDSVVLLSLLHQISDKKKLRLGALHVNHMIRGEEAVRDVRFCKSFCKVRGISFTCVSADIPRLAHESKTGLEETARNERYRILLQHAKENGYSLIATAHNATDNVETVLFHLARGASVHGACGISPRRNNIIRPLLPFSKDEINEYAKEKKLTYVIDSSNQDILYTRNAIRHNIIPHLKKINPMVEEAFFRFSEAARRDDDMLIEIAERYSSCDDTQVLSSLETAILSRVLLIKIQATTHNEITEKHISKIISLIRKASKGEFSGRYSLPGKIAVSLTKAKCRITQDKRIKKERTAPKTWETPLLMDGEIDFANRFRIRVSTSPSSQEKDDSILWRCVLSADALCGKLYARTRKEGDCYRAGRMTRKVKKMLCNYKIDVQTRLTLPIICDDNGILAIPFLPLADRVKIDQPKESTKLYIEIYSLPYRE